jgi:glycosyltransferase involved in cell wall biosynthesis
MKIGIDARLFGTNHGGIGRYSENLIKQLEKIDNNNQYFVFLQKNNFDEYQPKNKNFQKVLADFKAYSLSEQLAFPYLLYKYKLDLVHFTHFNAPIFYSKKYIVTIHDLIISHYPSSRATTLNPLLYKIKLFLYKVVVKLIAKKAKGIIAVSQYTKNDIVKLLKIKEDKIIVTHEGVDLPIAGEKSELGITKEFLLYVGSAYPHKNLEKLLQAFQNINKHYQLVLVGKKNYFYDRLKEEIKKLGLGNRVVLTGYLDDKKLANLYKTAKLYVFPSLMEGFGLPPLEAQSYDLPVVSSSATCLPEILGDSAVYFNPNDIDSISEKINQVLKSDKLMGELVQKGRENLKKYSWTDCAEETLAQYIKMIK